MLPDTPPPSPDYFPPLPLGLSDMNFLKPNLPPKPDSFLKLNLPPKPTFDNFARPLTKIIDEKDNTFQITPKKPLPHVQERNLFKQLKEIFPNFNQIIEEDNIKFKENNEKLTEILSKIGEDNTPFEFEIFTGGKNQKFEVHVNCFGLSTGDFQFLNFLQSDICEQILLTNKLFCKLINLKFILKQETYIIMTKTLTSQYLIFS